MSIEKVEMFMATCDNCGSHWEDDNSGICAMTDELSIKEQINNESWHTDGDKHYCSECWSYDDNDEIILKKFV